MRESNAPDLSTTIKRSAAKKSHLALLAAIIPLSLLCLLLVIWGGRPASAVTNVTNLPTVVVPGASVQDYSRFSHTSPQKHAELTGRANCASCHRRNDASPEPKFPVHKDCTGCHIVQFTGAINSSSVNPICTICHTPGDLSSTNPQTKKFPALVSFKAEFDHAQHMKGLDSARPSEGCAACHAPTRRGVAKTIPEGLGAHRTCYQCHSPGAPAGSFSSCGSCHGLGSYRQTPTSARAYRVSFSHGDHGPRQSLSCESCHNVRGRGLAQGRQVSSILPVQHFSSPRAQSCMSCHNGQRAFGDTDTRDCIRCHKGSGFRMRE